MYISLYQEYQNEETNTYVSELSLLFRRSPCQRCQISMSSGNTLEKALNKIGREDIVKKCIFNVELVTDDVEKAVARVRLDQPGFDSLKEELGPSRDTSLRRDATMDPKMDPDYDEFNKTKESESIEDLNISGSKRDTPKQHVTITNGTVFNGTSTPIKDKYASDEKELGDVMADFLEHKCHVSDTMSKKSRDEIDDEDKKRQRVIADANRIVSDVTEEAARRAQTLADQAYSMSKSESDFLQHSEPSYMETTTTEMDPETQERITRTVHVITTTTGTGSGADELRDSMQEIVDRFMMEERQDQ